MLQIPVGARIVVRSRDGVDEFSGRPIFRDTVGHVLSVSETTLVVSRDPAANGSRPGSVVSLDVGRIIRIKPIPERGSYASRR
ncbi:DUF6725 family protein [Alloscardovia macacae]|uniref:Uncharacterized protein n=1 Tax=Alloscardovia macacae TaxID=1160091 RepID=A0A1Y2T007_9BIFI|nr:DUF6725 family protein [Alloscardovia macacae]OTA26386.1 hypothetical protein B9G54_05240 [Alloscardovia macacae]OTA28808.1 hypothetical protein B9T39_05640 [Alloscardovia macacae]OZG53135.1 hypothetical protein ALMA_1437 [Alloscardovia macacae]